MEGKLPAYYYELVWAHFWYLASWILATFSFTGFAFSFQFTINNTYTADMPPYGWWLASIVMALLSAWGISHWGRVIANLNS